MDAVAILQAPPQAMCYHIFPVPSLLYTSLNHR